MSNAKACDPNRGHGAVYPAGDPAGPHGTGLVLPEQQTGQGQRGDGIDYTQPIEDTSILGDDLEIDEKYLDVTRNGGDIEPPEGDVNVHKDIDNILLIGTDERTRNSPGPGPTA